MKLRFSGHRVLISGGSCELALCSAELLMQEGLYPILTWRSDRGHHHISARLQPWSGQYEAACLDMAEPHSLDSLFQQLENELDYLVDFAQGDMESLVGAANPADIRCYFSENVSFRAELLRMAARAMLRKNRGRMVFVSSAAASKPHPGQGFYAAAKLASEALYRNVGLELGGRGVTTVSLRPGYIDAGRGGEYVRTHEQEVLKAVPLKRVLTCQEVAEAIVYFLSDNACAFNATEISMDGGLTAGK